MKIPLKEAQASLEENLRFTGGCTREFPSGTSPMKAIRRKCLDCTCGNRAEIRECVITNCALWPYRLGKNPFFNAGALAQESSGGE